MSIERWGLEERSSPRSTNSLRRKDSREFKTLPISVHGMEAEYEPAQHQLAGRSLSLLLASSGARPRWFFRYPASSSH